MTFFGTRVIFWDMKKISVLDISLLLLKLAWRACILRGGFKRLGLPEKPLAPLKSVLTCLSQKTLGG
jgi:hypothetical protein